jgi:hypothetical protein
MPRAAKARPLEEYHNALGRLLRQTQSDDRVSPKFRELVAKALEELQRTMLKP